MADRDVRLRRLRGFDFPTDQLSVYAADDEYYEGTILHRNLSATNELTAATNNAEMLLLKRVTAAGPTVYEKLTRTDVGEVAVGEKVPAVLLRVGATFETKVFASTGTGGISAGTALDSALGVIDGIIVQQQLVSDGSVEFFRLKNDLIASEGIIEVMVSNLRPV